MLSKWKREAETKLQTLFADQTAKERKARKAKEEEIEKLYCQIGKLTANLECLKKNVVSNFTLAQRRLLVDMNAKEISVAAQSALQEINRTGLYYKASQPSVEDLEIKKRID